MKNSTEFKDIVENEKELWVDLGECVQLLQSIMDNTPRMHTFGYLSMPYELQRNIKTQQERVMELREALAILQGNVEVLSTLGHDFHVLTVRWAGRKL